jgi:hemerythrin-like domain-containing protein
VRATQELAAEHRVIEQAMAALERAVVDAERTGVVPEAFIEDVVRFSRAFIDRCHHGKEERCFFPCLARRGVPVEGGPIETMLQEHEQGRRLVAVIEETLARHRGGRAALEDLLGACRDYIDLLRGHIEKETQMIFPLGDAVANEEDDAGTQRCFEETEAAIETPPSDMLRRFADTP